MNPQRCYFGELKRRSTAFLYLAFVLILSCLSLACKSTQQYINRGNQLYAAGQYADAAINYRNALKKAPNSGEAYYRLGLALLKQNQVPDAYQAFNHAVTLDPKNIPAQVQLATLSLAGYTRDPRHPAVLYKQAESAAEKLLAPGGDRKEGLRIRGALDLIDNKPDKAVADLREAARIAPNDAEVGASLAQALIRNNQAEEGEKVARQVIQQHPTFPPAYDVLYALYGIQQKPDQMEALLKSWSASDPKASTPILRLASLYYSRKQPEESEKLLKSMLDRRDRFPQADLLVGDFHSLARDYQQALADYQRGESRDQVRQRVYEERVASTLQALGRRQEAIKAADAILAKDPKSQFARVLKVEVLQQMGSQENMAMAATLARDLAKESPTNGRLQLLAGQVLTAKGDLNEAYEDLGRAAREEPQSEVVQLALARLETLRKNYPAVLQHADAALAIRRDDPAARLFRVMGLTGTHAYVEAKTEAEQLARDTKDAPQVEMQLAVIALGQKRYAEAEELFRKLYKPDSQNLEPLAGLVNTYEAENMPDRALALMKEEVQKSPESPGKAALLVATEEASGKTADAIAELQKMAVKSPSSADIQFKLGVIQQKSGHMPEALQAFERARQLAPDRKGIDAIVANLQEQLGKKTEAIASYRKALQKSPDDPAVLNNLAFLLADTGGDPKEAMQLVSTAIRKAPDLPQLRDTMAWVHIKQHDAAGAIPILQALTTKYPDDPTYRYHYAVALSDSGNREAAKQQAEKALSNQPPLDVAVELRGLIAQAK
ncbi:MAG TPA: tetratricopeptide repeat protein [Bryobacterales bacterium]|nr:tetratricopeptide repeat protein [Bryobacterales bacterium]